MEWMQTGCGPLMERNSIEDLIDAAAVSDEKKEFCENNQGKHV
jgi:hypothetical protein